MGSRTPHILFFAGDARKGTVGGGDDPTPLRVVGLSVRPSTVCKGLTYLRVSVYNPYINYLFYLFFLIFFYH